MVEWPSSEIIGLVTFIMVGFFIVIWLYGQLQEFSYYFGFRLSDAVSSDIGGLITSSGGVPGNVSLLYSVEGSSTSAPNRVQYKVNFANNLICLESVWSPEINTTDCYSIPSSNFLNLLPPSVKNNPIYSLDMSIVKNVSFYDQNLNYQKSSITILPR